MLLDHLPAGAVVGVSAPVATAVRVPEAAREALFASGVAPQRGGIAAYGELGHLPVVRDEAEARAVVGGILGPVLDYDRQHGAELLETLRTFLTCGRSWIRAAEELHVHRQTVVYRISRVERLTGKHVSETADLAGLWFAVSAYGLLADMQRLGPASG
ncbi:MAG: PucR family transcriptional regulator [Acidimicrobiales bacterium]